MKRKRAKLITDGGFSKMIDIDNKDGIPLTINYPLTKKITVASPETNIFDIDAIFTIEFMLDKQYKNYYVYKQINVSQSINRMV